MSSNNRVIFLGQTGSGKSTQARRLLTQAAPVTRLTILDPSHDDKLWGTRSTGLPIVERFNPRLRHQVIRVPIDGDETARWAEIVDACYWRGDGIVYIDEIYLCNPSLKAHPQIRQAIVAGRKRGVGLWSASQRPIDIPNVFLSEVDHVFCFRLYLDQDKKKVYRLTKLRVEWLEALRGHEYLYARTGADMPVLVTPRGH